MPKGGDKRKSRKKVRVVSGTRERYFKGKASKQSCGLCGAGLLGVPHGRRRSGISGLSKSEKRPTGVLGGVLCGRCRARVFEEASKVKYKAKGLSEVDAGARPYIEVAIKKVG